MTAQSFPVNAGTAGGTLLSIIVNISSGDLTRTIILAMIGAVVSFTVSLALKWMVRRFTGKSPPPEN